jgi:hypothetical protein
MKVIAGKLIAGTLGGLILAILGTFLVIMVLSMSSWRSWGELTFPFFWVAGISVTLYAKTAAKAWRGLLLSSAVLSFMLPLSAIIFTGSLIAAVPDSAATPGVTAGVAIGGGLISGFLGFIGFFLGVIFLIIGLLVGRNERLVYVQPS